MHRLDKIKNIIAFVLLAVIITSFGLLGKEHTVTRWLAAIGIVTWLITMFSVNYLKKKGRP